MRNIKGLAIAKKSWTEKAIATTALNYTTRNDFKKYATGAYHAARRLEIMDEVCAHMTSRAKVSYKPFISVKNIPGVYFLYSGDSIVYIGKSSGNTAGRLADHLADTDKLFDRIVVYTISNLADLEIAEVFLIAKHKPIYNKIAKNEFISTLVITNLDTIINTIIEFKINEI